MVLRVREPPLPRRRRHRDGGDGPAPRRRAPSPKPAVKRGVNWLLAMQNDDGGWAAFDRTKDRPLLEKIPFADHNAMQDPSCPDITGRVLECLGHCGLTADHPAVRRGDRVHPADPGRRRRLVGPLGRELRLRHLAGADRAAGGRRGHGRAVRPPRRRLAPQLPEARRELGRNRQSYDDPSLKGTGESTPSQTAWGAMGLMAAAGPDDPAVVKGDRMARRQPVRRRQLGRALLHRHRFPQGVLPQVSPLPPLLPADRAGAIPPATGAGANSSLARGTAESRFCRDDDPRAYPSRCAGLACGRRRSGPYALSTPREVEHDSTSGRSASPASGRTTASTASSSRRSPGLRATTTSSLEAAGGETGPFQPFFFLDQDILAGTGPAVRAGAEKVSASCGRGPSRSAR